MKKILLISIVLFLFSCEEKQKAFVSEGLVISNVNIIDVVDGKVIPLQNVLIEGDRITSIQSEELEVADSVEVIDGTGKYLIPGLWDMHTHYNWNHSYANNLLVANGVTGIREMWGDMNTINKIRDEIDAGTMIAPDIYTSGNIIDGAPKVWPGSQEVTNAEEATDAAAGQIKDGVDFLKVYSRLSRESYFAIAEHSKAEGVPFAGHVPISITIWEAMEADQQSFEHMYGLLEACTSQPEELAKAKDTQVFGPAISNLLVDTFDKARFDSLANALAESSMWASPTLIVLKNIANLDDTTFQSDPKLDYMPEFMKETWNPKNDFRFQNAGDDYFKAGKRKFALQLSLMGDLEKAGVKILAGTDYMNPYCYPGFSLHDELVLLVEGGMTEAGALRAATYNASLFMENEDIGTIAPGKMASLVLLNGNPLEDISQTKEIESVIFRGSNFDRSQLDAMLEEAKKIASETESNF